MRSLLLIVAVSGCGAPSSGDDDGPGSNDVIEPEPACDYAEVAGSWTATMNEIATLNMTVLETAELDEPIASGTSDLEDGSTCDWDLMCLGTRHNEWRVSRIQLNDGPCFVGYSFIRANDDDTLTMEAAESEFGPRISTAEMVRTD